MSKPRVLVIGLDGATLDLIRPWAAAGHLPHLARLLEEGSSGKLMSTIPPVSPAAWSSFITGKNPGKHGVFDFTVRDFRGYGMRVALRPSEPTLWGLLSAQGRHVCVVNVPQTYPPEKVSGYMVTGLGTPSARIFTYPAELTQALRKENYRFTTEALLQRDGTAAFIKDTYQVAEKVTDTALCLMSRLDWDFSTVVLRLTDQIPHYFWHWMDELHPAHHPSDTLHSKAVLHCYQKADDLVGKLITAVADRDTTVLVVSDHGFGSLHKDVYLNEWLRQQGLLKLRSYLTLRALFMWFLQRLGLTRTQVGHTLAHLGLHWLRGALRDGLGVWGEIFPQDNRPHLAELVDWDKTRAYSVGYIGQIYVNLVGRDPGGVVAPGREYEQFRTELIGRLLKMVDPEDGQRVVDQVLRKEEIYSGRFLPEAPDLLILMRGLSYITRQSYELAVRHQVFAAPPMQETGGHRLEGILLAWGAHIAKNAQIDNAQIEDVAPTVLHLLGCEVPMDMDGRVLTALLHPEFASAHPVKYSEIQRQQDMIENLTPEEEQSLLEHLRDLGYIE